MRRMSMALPALMLLTMVLVYGCQWTQSRKVSSGSPAVAAVEVGQTAPDLDGEDLTGDRLRLADYRGKVVVLSFWSKC